MPLSLLVRHKPEEYGYRADGEPAASLGKGVAIAGRLAADFRPGQVLKTQAFWVLTGAVALGIFGFTAMLVHVMPSLENGVFEGQRGKTGLVVTAMLLMSAVGRYGFGWLSDKWNKKMLLVVCYLFEAAGLVFFTFAHTVWMLIPFLVLFSLALGGQVVVRYALLRDYFGGSSFGGITGIIMAGITVPSLLAPPIAGWIFDTRGSYTWAWIAFALAAALAAPLALMMKRPSSRSSRPGCSDSPP